MLKLFRQQPQQDATATYEHRMQLLESRSRELDARLLNVEHDSKLLRDKVLRKLQVHSTELTEPETLNKQAAIGRPVRR